MDRPPRPLARYRPRSPGRGSRHVPLGAAACPGGPAAGQRGPAATAYPSAGPVRIGRTPPGRGAGGLLHRWLSRRRHLLGLAGAAPGRLLVRVLLEPGGPPAHRPRAGPAVAAHHLRRRWSHLRADGPQASAAHGPSGPGGPGRRDRGGERHLRPAPVADGERRGHRSPLLLRPPGHRRSDRRQGRLVPVTRAAVLPPDAAGAGRLRLPACRPAHPLGALRQRRRRRRRRGALASARRLGDPDRAPLRLHGLRLAAPRPSRAGEGRPHRRRPGPLGPRPARRPAPPGGDARRLAAIAVAGGRFPRGGPGPARCAPGQRPRPGRPGRSLRDGARVLPGGRRGGPRPSPGMWTTCRPPSPGAWAPSCSSGRERRRRATCWPPSGWTPSPARWECPARQRKLDDAWKNLLHAQHHDLHVCGPWHSRPHAKSMAEVGADLAWLAAQGARSVALAAQAYLAARVDTSGAGEQPLLVFNPRRGRGGSSSRRPAASSSCRRWATARSAPPQAGTRRWRKDPTPWRRTRTVRSRSWPMANH